jgi:exonuclease VII large subunit
MERMKVISCTTPLSNDNPAPIIREPTVPLINSNSNFRATLPSLTEVVFGPYHQDILEDQLEERNSLLQQQECQLQQCKRELRHSNMLLLNQSDRLHQLENQLQQRDAQLQQRDAQLQQQDAQLQQKCQKCFSDDCKPICSKVSYHVFEEKLIVGNHSRE